MKVKDLQLEDEVATAIDGGKVGTKDVDETDISDNRIIVYKADINKFIFVDRASGMGDMLKSVYDSNNNGTVDSAEQVDWNGVQNKPTFLAFSGFLKIAVGLTPDPSPVVNDLWVDIN